MDSLQAQAKKLEVCGCRRKIGTRTFDCLQCDGSHQFQCRCLQRPLDYARLFKFRRYVEGREEDVGVKINIEKCYLVGWDGHNARVELVLTGGYVEPRTVKVESNKFGDKMFRINLRLAIGRELLRIRREVAA